MDEMAEHRRPLGFVYLAGVTPSDERIFGGKACGLARLIEARARVPKGFATAATVAGPDSWTDSELSAFRERVAALLDDGPIAVRSSAPGEDSAARSFAGMFESVLGVACEQAALDAA